MGVMPKLLAKTVGEVVLVEAHMLGNGLARQRFGVVLVEVGHGLAHQALRLAVELAFVRQGRLEMRQRLVQAIEPLPHHRRHALVEARHLGFAEHLAQ